MVVGFDCTLRQHELRVWGRAIHSLCQLGGSDIHFQFTAAALILTTHDASVTTHVSLKFNKAFFSSYECERRGDDQNLECKIPTKCLLKPFRSVRFLAKSASECQIHYTQNGDSLDVTLFTRFGAMICYSLRLMSDVELLEVDCDISSLKSRVTCDAKIILGCLSNFQQVKGAGDLTLQVVGPQISLRNSVTDLLRREGKVYTELGLRDVDFMEYNIEEDTQLTFPLRDFKTLTLFADLMKLPVTLRFQNETQPVMVMIRSGDETYEGTLTLANRASREAPPQLRSAPDPVPTNTAQATPTSVRRPPSPPPARSERPSTSHAVTGGQSTFQSRGDTSEIQNGVGEILLENTDEMSMMDTTDNGALQNPSTPLAHASVPMKRTMTMKRPLMFPNATRIPRAKKPPTTSQFILCDSDDD